MARSSIGWRRSATRNTRADQRSEDGGQKARLARSAPNGGGWERLTAHKHGDFVRFPEPDYQFAALILPILQSSL